MKLLLISGDGIGAGKTSLANKLGNVRLALADGIREDLSLKYPKYDFFNRSQEYKNTFMPETGCTIRQMMLSHGQLMKEDQGLHYWCELLQMKLKPSDNITYAIDDIRMVFEVDWFKSLYLDCLHIHVVNSLATKEPFENDVLRSIADYRINWSTKHAQCNCRFFE